MKIAFDYQIFALQTYGGISRYFVRLAEQLTEKSEDVRIFAPLYCNNYLAGVPQNIVDGYKVPDRLAKYARFAIPYNELVGDKRIVSWGPDIIHETYFSSLNRCGGTSPTILTVYDMVHELFPDQFSSVINLSGIKRKAVERADHVLCISESTRCDLIRLFGVDESRVSVVHLGVDTPNVATHPFQLDDGKPYILYVGNRQGYKNFHSLVEAYSRSSFLSKDFTLLAFGGGEFSQKEVSLISSLGLSEFNVRHIGGDDGLLARLYAGASLFIYPSMYEGFGLPPLEAMAHNCPVLVSNTSSLPEVVGSGGGYFDPASIEDILHSMEHVLSSPGRIETLKELGQERVKRFSWQQCAKDTLAVYEKVRGNI